jgi:hypothetical protein
MNALELLGDMGFKEARIVEKTDSYVGVMIKIPYGQNMLMTEENIQQSMNEGGKLATECALSRYDTDGSPITVAKIRYTSKGLSGKYYQSPYGDVYVQRHVYQNSSGGSTFCPLDNDADIIVSTTPKFAKMVSSKYSRNASTDVQRDLNENHSRYVARSYIQNISQSVSEIVESRPSWTYSIPVDPRLVYLIAICLDGTCMLLSDGKYRQAMVGSISLYNFNGERLYTRYTAMPPEYGKGRFYETFIRDIESVKKLYPNVNNCIGVADGAADNWTFLQAHTQIQVLDFFHASQYLAGVSHAAFKRAFEGKKWLEESLHALKHEENGAKELLAEMEKFLKKRITKAKKAIIQSAITYFSNQIQRMNYEDYQNRKIPIGSGVIEAACKVIIKQRMCQSGMKWTDAGAKTVLALRCIYESDTMWEQFWEKISNNNRRKLKKRKMAH